MVSVRSRRRKYVQYYYCLSCPEFQFDFIYEYASPALKVELRKLSRDDQSEKRKLKQIVRMKDGLVSRRFDFVRKDTQKRLVRGFRRQRMGTVPRIEAAPSSYMTLDRSMTAPAKALVLRLSRSMSTAIAGLPLLRRQQSKRHFPALIFDRSETASRTVIEKVHVNTLKVVATFPSQIEAERQTGMPRSHTSQGLRRGRPVWRYFWRYVRSSFVHF
jgi:hypothetical protein